MEKESDIQQTILDYFSYAKVFHYRQNSGGGYKSGDRFIPRFASVSGLPDIVCIIRGKYIGIEVKTAKGKQSESQTDFQKELESAGGTYILARSLDEVIEKLESVL